MAGRTSVGVGFGVTMGILIVACIGLFISSVLFLSQKGRAERELRDAEGALSNYVKSNEREADEYKEIVDQAKSESQSAVAFLRSSLQESVGRVTGFPEDSIEQMKSKLAALKVADGSSLIQVIRDRDSQIAKLTSSLEQAEAGRQRALADLRNEVDRVKGIEDTHRKTLADVDSKIAQYKAEVDELRSSTEELRKFMDQQIQRISQEFAAEKTALLAQLDKSRTETQTLQEQLNKLRGQRTDVLTGPAEFALVDGDVIGLNATENQYFIGRGRRDKIVLGMRFVVYADATAIRPSPDGEYPRGKAVLEVIRIDDRQSTCRIVPGSEIRGNPIVRGDVVANAIYDPQKVYKFVVFGNFDADGDGQSTPLERGDISALIAEWGGSTIPDLAGDVDFLVLGERPVLPPPPPATASIEIIREFQRLNAEVIEYDRLRDQAIATSVPILNQNRLFTLIGR